jgi:hypothetical protein
VSVYDGRDAVSASVPDHVSAEADGAANKPAKSMTTVAMLALGAVRLARTDKRLAARELYENPLATCMPVPILVLVFPDAVVQWPGSACFVSPIRVP